MKLLSLPLRRAAARFRDDVRGPRGVLLLVSLGLVVVSPFVLRQFLQSVVLQIIIFSLAVTSWNLIAGYYGMFSFTHAALFGVGAYTTVIATSEFGVPAVAALALGGLAAGVLSLPITLPSLRLGGSYVAMITLAYAEIIHLAAITFRDITGGPTGYTGFEPMFGGDRVAYFYFVLAVVAFLVFLQYLLLVSRYGLIARAIRESEDAAQMLGNNTYRHKLGGFFIGSAIAGVAGGLQAYNILIISPPMLELTQMIRFMAMAVIGGLGVFGGPIVGVVVVVGVSELLRGLGDVRLLVWGLMLLVVILFFPSGIAGSSIQRGLLRDQLKALRQFVTGSRGEER